MSLNEEQFVLRLPPELATRLRRSISKKKNSETEQSKFSYTINEDRTGLFTCDGKEYPATLMDLPCIVESHKTADKRTFYKSADVHQVLVVRNPGEPAPEGECLADGLTKGAQGARERVKVADGAYSAEEVAAVEKQIKLVLDKKVQFVRKKKPAEESDHEEEIIIEEEGGKRKDQVSPPRGASHMPKPPVAPASSVPEARPALPGSSSLPTAKASSPSPAPVSSPLGILPGPSESATRASSLPLAASPPPAGSPPPASSPAMSPLPEASAAEEEEDEDDEDLSAWAEDMLEQDKEEEPVASEEEEHAKALKRIERAKFEKKVEEQRQALAQQTRLAENMPNFVLKQRFLAKKDEMQQELTRLELELAKV